MQKLIMDGNQQFENKEASEEEREAYNLWKEKEQNKLDDFRALNRLTQSQYNELSGMFLEESKGQAKEQEADQPAGQ